MLRAIAEKLIPGIPEETRVSILQQTHASDANTDDLPPDAAEPAQGSTSSPTVLEHVIDGATARDELEREINGVLDSSLSERHRQRPWLLTWHAPLQRCRKASTRPTRTLRSGPCARCATSGSRSSTSSSTKTPGYGAGLGA